MARQRTAAGWEAGTSVALVEGPAGREAGEVRAVKASCPVEGVARAARPHLPQQR